MSMSSVAGVGSPAEESRTYPIITASITLKGKSPSEFRSKQAAMKYMQEVGLKPTPEAIDQMALVFEECLRIMCERPYDPQGRTWRKSGRMGMLHAVRGKFERLWFFYWDRGVEHRDSVFDMINFAGFLLRSDNNRYGEWGEPAPGVELP